MKRINLRDYYSFYDYKRNKIVANMSQEKRC